MMSLIGGTVVIRQYDVGKMQSCLVALAQRVIAWMEAKLQVCLPFQSLTNFATGLCFSMGLFKNFRTQDTKGLFFLILFNVTNFLVGPFYCESGCKSST